MQEMQLRDFKSVPLLRGELGSHLEHPLCASAQAAGMKLSNAKESKRPVYLADWAWGVVTLAGTRPHGQHVTELRSKPGLWGSSLVVQWLRFCASTAGGWARVQPLIRELSSCVPCGTAMKSTRTVGHAVPWVLLSVCSVVSDSVSPWTGAHEVPLSVGFPRQEYWMGCHFLLQKIFLTEGSRISCPGRQILYHCATWGLGSHLKGPSQCLTHSRYSAEKRVVESSHRPQALREHFTATDGARWRRS